MPRVIDYLRSQHERCVLMLPEGHDEGLRGKLNTWRGVGVVSLFDFNQRLIEKRWPDMPNVWSADDFPWMQRVADATPQIRAEIDRYLDDVVMPQVAEVNGLDPESDEAKWSVPGLQGRWRTTILFLMGRWLEPSDHFPVTRSVTSGIKGVTNVGFTGLDPHSHIDTHVGPNKGGLRFQLPIIVPGEEGDCRIRVTENMIVWHEGEPVVFDLAVNHEVWNDSDGLRILLMMEIVAPMPTKGLDLMNRFTQHCYRWFPSFLGMHGRIDALDRRQRVAA
jgi:aspartyl/asparaginyl beta-hydroxylase (cupin superfamily)